jgi:predicted amidohydrolase YtcJ
VGRLLPADDAIAGPAEEIVHTEVISTWFAGREVYTR